jgi:hypothetical protein
MEAISIFDDNACEPRVEYRGRIVDEIEYYLGLAGYCLHSPLLDDSDIEFLKFFVLTLLVRHHLAEVWGDPMDEVVAMLAEDYRRTGDCCVAVCLGAEIALAAFRRHGRMRDAAFLGLALANRRELLEGHQPR